MSCVKFCPVPMYDSAGMEFWPLSPEQRIKLVLITKDDLKLKKTGQNF